MTHLPDSRTTAGFELVCSANTLRFADLPTRMQAAENAGFTGIGLRLDDYRRGGLHDGELRDLLAEHHLRVFELEYNWDWAAPEPAPEEAAMFRLADAVGYRQLNLTMFEEHRRESLVGAFRRLCDRAADHGLLVGLEFLPYTRIRTLRQAWRIVSEADRENAGVIIDAWHWNRAGTAPEDLDGIPPAKITSVQLCDVLPQPLADMTTEARHHRQLPGAGAGGVAELVSTLRGHGIASPVSVEVFSDDLDALSADEAARLAGEAGRRCLSSGGWPSTPWTTNQEGAGCP